MYVTIRLMHHKYTFVQFWLDRDDTCQIGLLRAIRKALVTFGVFAENEEIRFTLTNVAVIDR